MAGLLTLKNTLLALFIASAVAFFAGMYTHSRLDDAERTDALQTARKDDVRVVADAVGREARIAKALSNNNDFFALKESGIPNLPYLIETSNEPVVSKVCPRDPVLSDDLVRLLNASP